MLRRLVCFFRGHTPLDWVNLEQGMRPCARCGVVLFPYAWMRTIEDKAKREHWQRGAPLFPW